MRFKRTIFSGSLPLSLLTVTALTTVTVMAAAATTEPMAQQAIQQPNLMAQTVTQGLQGEVDIALPVKITFINQTAVALAIETPGNDTFDIDPNEQMSSPISQYSAYFFVQPVQQDLSLDFDVQIQNNQITVEVQTSNSNTPSDGALKIDRMGYIYVY